MIGRSIVFALLLAAGLLPATNADAGAPPPPAAAEAVAATDPTDRADPPDQADPIDPNDLGRGLRYVRFSDLALAEPVAAALAAPALILDLRLATAEPAAEARLRELLPQRDVARPLFLLLGADTPAALRSAIPASAPGVLTLASVHAGIAVSLTVSTDLARDHAVMAALAAGRPVCELIEEKLDKPRFDEARLARNHANGRRGNDNEDVVAPPTPEPKDISALAPTAGSAPPLQDLVLQRAVFLHRALLALGRLPQKE